MCILHNTTLCNFGYSATSHGKSQVVMYIYDRHLCRSSKVAVLPAPETLQPDPCQRQASRRTAALNHHLPMLARPPQLRERSGSLWLL